MAEIHRKLKHAGKAQRLLDVAIEMRDLVAARYFFQQVMILNGWLPTKGESPEPVEQPAPTDMSRLLASIESTNGNQTAQIP